MARLLVVPWSRDRIYLLMACLPYPSTLYTVPAGRRRGAARALPQV